MPRGGPGNGHATTDWGTGGLWGYSCMNGSLKIEAPWLQAPGAKEEDMKTTTHCRLGRLLAILSCLLPVSAAGAGLVSATDVNPDPNIFEAYLTADELEYEIDGTTVHALVYRDDPPAPHTPAPAGIPAPLFELKIGDQVIVHFRSELDAGYTSIHWHGIELDNDSDGTGVSQDRVANGQEHVYRFTVTRPGIFWYHPHMRPAHQNHAGMYGAMVVRHADQTSDTEGDLEGAGIIPSNAHTFVLSDINFDPATGLVGFDVGGTWKTVHEMIQACSDGLEQDPPVMDTMNCRIAAGDTILVNGEKPDPVAMTPKIFAQSGEGIRLKLLNPSIARYFRLRVVDNNDTNMYRIGGEGGFLEHVRLEGGVQGTWDTKYDLGEILLAPANRADVVIVPEGNDGDIIRVVTQDYASNPNANANGNDQDVLYIEIQGSTTPFSIAPGNPVLGPDGIEDLKGKTITDHLLPPPPGEVGSTLETIRLVNFNADGPGPMIDDVRGHFEDSGPDFTAVPHEVTTRWAKIGQVLELTVRNETSAHHPFHLHGFSVQPVRVTDDMGNSLYEFDYDEFLDVFDVHQQQQYVVRLRIEDRPITCDDVVNPYPCFDRVNLGSVGRWVFHCHIVHHAGLGMISELVVLPTGACCMGSRPVVLVRGAHLRRV